MTDLHGANAGILSVLPASEGLLSAVSYKDLVVELMASEIAKNTHEKDRLERLRDCISKEAVSVEKSKLHVNKDKNLLLALAFPEIYTQALALVTGQGIRFELWSNSSPTLHHLEGYFFENRQDYQIFTRVAVDPEVQESHDEFGDVNVFLRCNKILRHIGYGINLTSFELEKLEMAEDVERELALENPPLDVLDNRYVFVDLYNWFCSCDKFDACTSAFSYTAGDLLQNCADNALHSILCNSLSKHPRSLPLCRHLLAVVLVVMNWSASKEFHLFEYC